MMPETDFDLRMRQYGEMINNALLDYLPGLDLPQKNVFEAMKYSVTAGGKRIRPVLTLEFCRICGGDVEAALPFACAVEFIHSYSLIHDDLPCMDDDDLRRGRPSCHIKFGEATALLAGDALISLAFETALCDNSIEKVGAKNACRAAHELARASGAVGMVGGQIVDLESEGHSVSLNTLEFMHENKTGAMIRAAAKIGCIVAGADERHIEAADEYAKRIGLAFQIVDDLLDVEGDVKALGKPTGSDKDKDKTTYITLLGAEKSRSIVTKLTQEAIGQLAVFSDPSFLTELSLRLSNRKH